MGNSGVNLLLNTICAALVLLLLLSFRRVNGQISTPCTTSMITSFTPCLNFITGSSANGLTSPTQDCCDAVDSIMTDSVDCACLIITGNVPLSLPFNRTLAITLPQACNGGVPLRCKSSGVPLPAPGPVLFAPPPPEPPTSQAPAPAGHARAPGHAHAPFISPRASKASLALAPAPAPAPIDDTTSEITPASSPKASHAAAPGAYPRIRPVLNPAPSASPPSYNSATSLLLMMIATIAFQTLLY